jgi:hypothetical protein
MTLQVRQCYPEAPHRTRNLPSLSFQDSRNAGLYRYWDYVVGTWQRNNVIHIDRRIRSWEKPFDQVPSWIDLRRPVRQTRHSPLMQ